MVEDGFADVPLIVETAQAFDTHHVALLVAAGASGVVRIWRSSLRKRRSRAG